MTFARFAIPVLFLFPSPGSGMETPDAVKAREYLERGNAWSEGGEWDQAIKDYSEAIRLDPKNAEIFVQRGLALHGKGTLDQAMKDFDEAIRIDPKNPKAFFGRGVALAAQREFDEAIAAYTEAIRLDPKYAHAYIQRSCSHQWKRDWVAGLKDAEEGVKLAPKLAGAFYARGTALQGKGDWGDALADFEKAIQLDPGYVYSHINKAQILATGPDEKVRDGKKAVKAAKQACELTGWKYTYALEAYAAASAEIGEFEEAVKWQKKVLEDSQYLKIHGTGPRARLNLYESKMPFRMPAIEQKGCND
jgi:tetratricopeptide (TPR) repeat protein